MILQKALLDDIIIIIIIITVIYSYEHIYIMKYEADIDIFLFIFVKVLSVINTGNRYSEWVEKNIDLVNC